jgi:hypothetical protein
VSERKREGERERGREGERERGREGESRGVFSSAETGRGAHSAGGVAKIRPKVKAYLDQNRYEETEVMLLLVSHGMGRWNYNEKSGVFLVYFRPNRKL